MQESDIQAELLRRDHAGDFSSRDDCDTTTTNTSQSSNNDAQGHDAMSIATLMDPDVELSTHDGRTKPCKDPHTHHRIDRTTRSWSWPLDVQQQRIISTHPLAPLVDGHGQRLFRWCQSILWYIFAALLMMSSVGVWRYAIASEPQILGGWSDMCPPGWIYYRSPTMILLGYQNRFEGVVPPPPWGAVRRAHKAYTKCWHGDRNKLHQANNLNLTFPVGTWEYEGINGRILARGNDAYDLLTHQKPLSSLSNEDNKQLFHTYGSACQKPCRFRDAFGRIALAAMIPFADPTASHPRTVGDLSDYCPCSLRLALHDLRETNKHLPRPRSIHPFYADRSSSLYKHWDLYSWWVWLWGNNFFWPWRKRHIDELSDGEQLELYVEGFWTNQMAGKRYMDNEDVREARGIRISR